MDEAATTTGEADRAQRWADVDRRVTALAPGVPIVWNREPNLRSEDVKGVSDPRPRCVGPQLHFAAGAMSDAPPTGSPLRFAVRCSPGSAERWRC